MTSVESTTYDMIIKRAVLWGLVASLVSARLLISDSKGRESELRLPKEGLGAEDLRAKLRHQTIRFDRATLSDLFRLPMSFYRELLDTQEIVDIVTNKRLRSLFDGSWVDSLAKKSRSRRRNAKRQSKAHAMQKRVDAILRQIATVAPGDLGDDLEHFVAAVPTAAYRYLHPAVALLSDSMSESRGALASLFHLEKRDVETVVNEANLASKAAAKRRQQRAEEKPAQQRHAGNPRMDSPGPEATEALFAELPHLEVGDAAPLSDSQTANLGSPLRTASQPALTIVDASETSVPPLKTHSSDSILQSGPHFEAGSLASSIILPPDLLADLPSGSPPQMAAESSNHLDGGATIVALPRPPSPASPRLDDALRSNPTPILVATQEDEKGSEEHGEDEEEDDDDDDGDDDSHNSLADSIDQALLTSVESARSLETSITQSMEENDFDFQTFYAQVTQSVPPSEMPASLLDLTMAAPGPHFPVSPSRGEGSSPVKAASSPRSPAPPRADSAGNPDAEQANLLLCSRLIGGAGPTSPLGTPPRPQEEHSPDAAVPVDQMIATDGSSQPLPHVPLIPVETAKLVKRMVHPVVPPNEVPIEFDEEPEARPEDEGEGDVGLVEGSRPVRYALDYVLRRIRSVLGRLGRSKRGMRIAHVVRTLSKLLEELPVLGPVLTPRLELLTSGLMQYTDDMLVHVKRAVEQASKHSAWASPSLFVSEEGNPSEEYPLAPTSSLATDGDPASHPSEASPEVSDQYYYSKNEDEDGEEEEWENELDQLSGSYETHYMPRQREEVWQRTEWEFDHQDTSSGEGDLVLIESKVVTRSPIRCGDFVVQLSPLKDHSGNKKKKHHAKSKTTHKNKKKHHSKKASKKKSHSLEDWF